MGLKDRLAVDVPTSVTDGEETAVARLRRKLTDEVDLDAVARLNATELKSRLETRADRLLRREGIVISQEERAALIRRIVDEMVGLGVLEPLLADESVTEIMVNGPDDVWVERKGRLERVEECRFRSEEQLRQTIERIVSTVDRRVDESRPMVDARLPTGERVNIVVPPLSLRGPCITIRRFPTAYSMDELIAMESIDQSLADLLVAFVRARFNLVVSGGTGTGKTTFLNALSAFIPADERIITIEDAAELQLRQPHVVSLESKPPNVEGRGEFTIRDLVRNSLRMRPDRIIVGEVRGGETLDMLQAMNTGHEGSLTTVHANSPADAILRLETLATMTDLNVSFGALRDQINRGLQVFVHLERALDGSRRVRQVAVVTSRRRERFKLTTIAEFVPDRLLTDRVVTGRYLHHGLPQETAERLRRLDLDIPEPFDQVMTPEHAVTVEEG